MHKFYERPCWLSGGICVGQGGKSSGGVWLIGSTTRPSFLLPNSAVLSQFLSAPVKGRFAMELEV